VALAWLLKSIILFMVLTFLGAIAFVRPSTYPARQVLHYRGNQPTTKITPLSFAL
jgi:hypothetical protein